MEKFSKPGKHSLLRLSPLQRTTRKTANCLFLGLFFFSISCSSDDAEPESNFVEETLATYEASFQGNGGFTASLFNADGTSFTGAFGESEEGVNLAPTMSFAIGSISKTFTSVLTLGLLDEGKLSLEDSVGLYLPDIADEKISGSITIGQLLYHNSGLHHPLPGSDGLFNYVINNPSENITFEKYKSFMATPIAAPGESYSYSDANYKVLGMIIEEIEGTSFEEVLNTKILEPLGMENTFIGNKGTVNSSAYSWVNAASLKDLDRTAVQSMGNYTGNIWSTPEDLNRWFRAIFEGSILNASTVDLITTFYAGDRGVNYGAGMFYEERAGKAVYWHSGFTIAYQSYCGYLPETDQVWVVYTNQFNDEQIFSVLNDLFEQMS